MKAVGVIDSAYLSRCRTLARRAWRQIGGIVCLMDPLDFAH